MAAAFYERRSKERYSATTATVGPWDPKLSHGSPPAALLLHAIDVARPRPDARVGRIAFDFFGPVPAGELTVATEIVRPGARIELSRARLAASGKTVMEASAWRLARSPGRVPAVPDRRAPPRLPAAQEQTSLGDIPFFGYGRALEWRFVEGAFTEMGPATVYTRPLLPLIDGEPLSALGRLLLMVDSANGVSAALPFGEFLFVPVELTVSVRRDPATEWIGMRAETTIEADGLGQTRAELFDEEGYIGSAVQTLFVGPRGA
jgi:hypothetical protein